MRLSVSMPQLGQSIAEGTVVRWLKREGDRVAKDESIVEISTDKVNSELPAPAAGVLARILVAENAVVKVGAVLAELEVPEESAVPPLQSPIENRKSKIIQPSAPAGASPPASPGFLSPAVRAKARELGLSEADLAKIPGTGTGGRVTVADVEKRVEVGGTSGPNPRGSRPESAPTAAAGAPPPSSIRNPQSAIHRVPMDPVRRAVAANLTRSAQTIPQVTTVAEADLTAIAEHRERTKAEFERRHGCKLTYVAYVAEAAVKALGKFPLLNASVDGETIVLHDGVHLGIAVALPETPAPPGGVAAPGLIVPVIRDAQALDRPGLARAAHDLAERARSKALAVADVQGATFTLTNPGVFGNLLGTPLIPPPQAAILSMGALQKRPVARGGTIAARDTMYLSLTYDHRLIDGMLAGQFLQRVVELLEDFREI